jgi:hypothetical protein
LGVHAQEVTPYTPGMMPEGVVYYLPKTLLQIKITASQTKYTPGEFCQYADRYLRLKDVSAHPEEHWVIKSLEVTPFGVPNPELAYSIKLKDKSVSSQVELTEDGIIKAINTTAPVKESITKPVVQKEERLDPRKFMTEEILMAGSSIKMAELIAKEIYTIRESKNSLTRGQADYMPQDGAALKIMLNNLEIQEKAMTEMFTGITEITDHTFTFYVEPTKNFEEQILFRFSKKLGMLETNNLAGEPIFISISDESALPEADEAAKANKKLAGIIYNIPGKGRVSIESIDKGFYEDEHHVAQFGETEVLVNDLFNKKINTRVIFNPTTGGIVKIDKD